MLPGAWEPELKPGNLAPRSGHRGCKLYGQVVINQQRDLGIGEIGDPDVESLGRPFDGDTVGVARGGSGTTAFAGPVAIL